MAYKIGTSGSDSMQGTTGTDTLLGMAGDDTIYGLGGTDSLDGGSGNDLIVGTGKLDGGSGDDTMQGLPGVASTYYIDSDYDVVIAAAIDWSTRRETIADFMAYGNKVIYAGSTELGQFYMPEEVQVAQITAFSDIGIVGNEASNYIQGNGLTNYLDGAGGNDIIDGNGGFDIIVGGTGNDTIFGNGYLVGAEDNDSISGSGALFGGEGNDIMIGGSGADTIVPGDGTDTMDGGNGADVYMLSMTDDVDILNDTGTSGRDSIQSEGNVDLAVFRGIEEIELLDGGVVNAFAYGNEADNSIKGNADGNKLFGNGGNDTILGEGGSDSIAGGAGNDSLEGGLGRDSLDGGQGVDTLVGGADNDTYYIDSTSDRVIEAADGGTFDVVRGTISFTVMDNVESGILVGATNLNLTARATVGTRLTGNSGRNTLTGGTGNDTLYGAAGVDTLIGGSGSDNYTLTDEDVIIESADDEGLDFLVTTLDYTVVADNVEYVNMRGFAFEVYGNDSDNLISGNDIGNYIDGGYGDDQLFGGGDDDTLVGGFGDDALYGGAGNDTFLFSRDGGADVINEAAVPGGNNDTLAFQEGIAYDQVWLTRAGNDLNLSVIGTTDSVKMRGFFSTTTNTQVETFTASGLTMTAGRVQALVTAMAGMAVPTGTTLTAAQQSQLSGALAAAWQ